MSRRSWVSVAVALLVATRARAAPTGLNVIPTTDLVPVRQLSVALQNGNTEVRGDSSVWHQPQLVFQSEAGLPWNCEGGVDVAPSAPPGRYRPQFNLKWKPLAEAELWPAVAGLVSQLGPHFTTNYSLIASKTLNFDAIEHQKFRAHRRNIKLRGIRLHAGIQRTFGNRWHALVGSDLEVSDRLVLYADWTSGAASAVTLGGVFVIDRDDSAQLALFRGNDQNRLSGVQLTLTHTFSW